jgi:hypothetical protein
LGGGGGGDAPGRSTWWWHVWRRFRGRQAEQAAYAPEKEKEAEMMLVLWRLRLPARVGK